MGLYVYPIVGRFGLGNMMFSWARAVVISKKYNCKMIAPDWVVLSRIGPWLRGERDKRYYLNQFSSKGYISGLAKKYLVWKANKVQESDLGNVDLGNNDMILCKGMDNFFDDLIGHNRIVKDELLRILSKNIVHLYDDFNPEPFIGVHIRRGDFLLEKGVAPDKSRVTPDAWYLSTIRKVRELAGTDMKCLVFSDGTPAQLEFLSELDNIEIMNSSPAIIDILRLSKSKFLITSTWSTFSMWAAYFGGMPNVWYPSKQMVPVMPDEKNYQFKTDFDGNFPDGQEDFVREYFKEIL